MNQARKSLELSLENDFLEKIDLRTLLYPLWLNKWLIIIITGICLLIGIGYACIKVPLYSSNVLLQIEDNTNGLSAIGMDSSASSLLTSKGASASTVQTTLIKSRYILEPVIYRLNLDIKVTPVYFPIFGQWYARKHANTLDKPWWGLSFFSWGNETLKISQFVVPLAEQNKKFTLIALEDNHFALYDSNKKLIVKGEVGKKATVILPNKGQYVVLVGALQAGVNTHFYIVKESMQKTIDRLAHQLVISDLSEEMQLGDKSGILTISLTGPQPTYLVNVLNEITKIAVIKNTHKKSAETIKTISFINQQLPIVKNSLNKAETILNRYMAQQGIIDLNSASKLLLTEMEDAQKSLNLITMNKAAALQKYTSAHPFILAMNEREKIFRDRIILLQKQISQLPARDQIIVGLMRDVRIKNQLYLILLNKIEALKISNAETASDVSVLGSATFPNEPLPSGIPSILLFSLLMGLILGTLFVYLLQLWNRKISDPAMIESKFNLTNMAIIPYSEKQEQMMSNNNRKIKIVSILGQTEPKDLSIEALRNFRTSLQFVMMNIPNNIITIVGVAPAVGKSFISVNFSYLQADSGKKVLLIDGDIRKGHLKDYFHLGLSHGLCEVICGICTFKEAVVRGPIENFDFLGTGAYPPNPSELLMSPQFKELLEQVSKIYDLVIIDTAPILAVTDAAVIASHAGANFMVLASNTHETQEIELALKRFNANGVTINGVVFNFSKSQKRLYRYTQPHQYQYEYK